MVSVTVTSTRPWLQQQRTIRAQQQSIAVTLKKWGQVDAFGLALKPDCIHLTAEAAVQLGEELAVALWKLNTKKEARGGHDVVEVAGGATTTTRAAFNKKYGVFQDAVAHARAATETSCWDCGDGVDSSSSGRRVSSIWRQSGLRAVNFTQGELRVLDFCRVLATVYDSSSSSSSIGCSDERTFVDLGCAGGVCVAAAFLTSHARQSSPTAFTRVVGVDLMQSKIVECRALLEALAAARPGGPAACAIEGNFLDRGTVFDWTSPAVDVVYACATCFSEDVMDALTEGFALLKTGARVVLIDKQLPSDANAFALVGSMQVASSWGEAFAYVYRRT
jgi:hypothetical protein